MDAKEKGDAHLGNGGSVQMELKIELQPRVTSLQLPMESMRRVRKIP